MRTSYDKHVEPWSPISSERRRQLLWACMAEECIYSDNVSYTRGPAGLAAVMDNFQRKTPNGHSEIDPFSVQHNRALIHWRATDGRDSVRFSGIDAAIFGEDRKLVQISSFFEKPAGMA